MIAHETLTAGTATGASVSNTGAVVTASTTGEAVGVIATSGCCVYCLHGVWVRYIASSHLVGKVESSGGRARALHLLLYLQYKTRVSLKLHF